MTLNIKQNHKSNFFFESLITLPNLLSLARIPLAFIFLQSNPFIRFFTIFIAGCTDFFDGYLARRYKISSRLGTFLDPLTDKFFVFFVLGILINEGYLNAWQVLALMCRDIALILFFSYLVIKGKWTAYKVRAFWCGKIATAMQFLILSSLSIGIKVPDYAYIIFPLLGGLALLELYCFQNMDKKVKEAL